MDGTGWIGGGKPFYDGTRIFPHSVGIAAGTRATPSQQPAGAAFSVETNPPLLFDRPGLLAMTISKGNAGPSRFLPGLTYDRPGRLAFGNGGPDTNNSELFFALNPMHVLDGGYTIIGQCDPASVAILESIAHLPRDASNHPIPPVVIRHIVIQP